MSSWQPVWVWKGPPPADQPSSCPASFSGCLPSVTSPPPGLRVLPATGHSVRRLRTDDCEKPWSPASVSSQAGHQVRLEAQSRGKSGLCVPIITKQRASLWPVAGLPKLSVQVRGQSTAARLQGLGPPGFRHPRAKAGPADPPPPPGLVLTGSQGCQPPPLLGLSNR